LFYTHVFTKPKDTYSKTTQLGVTFASGYTAGVICAIVSHPADSLVSLLGKPANKGKSLGQIVKETGFGKLATKVTPIDDDRLFPCLTHIDCRVLAHVLS
jgi:solute carrier family 25 (mitochondrial phosphate transporter), member 3